MIDYSPKFLSQEEADALFSHLLNDMNWRVSYITGKEGKRYKIPRLQCWMSDPGVRTHLYQKEPALPWSPLVTQIRERIEQMFNFKFDYVLLNYYRNGYDKIGFHRDEEATEKDKNVIASISLGAVRKFQIKKRFGVPEEYLFYLPHGSCLMMRGNTQLHWLHSVPQQPEITQPRINLTFRKS